MKILGVGDNEFVRFTIQRLLRQNGFSVAAAETGGNALDLAAS